MRRVHVIAVQNAVPPEVVLSGLCSVHMRSNGADLPIGWDGMQVNQGKPTFITDLACNEKRNECVERAPGFRGIVRPKLGAFDPDLQIAEEARTAIQPETSAPQKMDSQEGEISTEHDNSTSHRNVVRLKKRPPKRLDSNTGIPVREKIEKVYHGREANSEELSHILFSLLHQLQVPCKFKIYTWMCAVFFSFFILARNWTPMNFLHVLSTHKIFPSTTRSAVALCTVVHI